MKPRPVVLLVLIALSVAARLIPYALSTLGVPIDPANTIYPWNFSPILPICLFGGAVYANRRLVYAIPFATFLVGDVGIWALSGRMDWAFYAHQPVVYLFVALVATTGFLARGHRSWQSVATAGLLSSVLFFVLTNFAVWSFSDGAIYPHTASGLVACYVAAIPYVRNSLISMALFLPLLFSRASLTATEPKLAHLATQGG